MVRELGCPLCSLIVNKIVIRILTVPKSKTIILCLDNKLGLALSQTIPSSEDTDWISCPFNPLPPSGGNTYLSSVRTAFTFSPINMCFLTHTCCNVFLSQLKGDDNLIYIHIYSYILQNTTYLFIYLTDILSSVATICPSHVAETCLNPALALNSQNPFVAFVLLLSWSHTLAIWTGHWAQTKRVTSVMDVFLCNIIFISICPHSAIHRQVSCTFPAQGSVGGHLDGKPSKL